jgi:hypothetical protein
MCPQLSDAPILVHTVHFDAAREDSVLLYPSTNGNPGAIIRPVNGDEVICIPLMSVRFLTKPFATDHFPIISENL